MAEWGFYGRTEPLRELRRVVEAGRWFFCRIEGRRRIGKTTLLGQLARKGDDFGSKLIYMQTPDSDERDVAATFRRSLDESDRNEARALANSVVDFPSMATAIGELCRAGVVVVLDEFQYFTRSALRHFNSFLQAEVDKLRSAALTRGGIFVLGSLHSDMSALLEDKAAPLYGRITAQLRLDHWEFEDLMSVFRSQGVESTAQWLTLWTFFEGVPKFYHDAFEQRLFEVPPQDLARELLVRMFLRGSSPLSEEADTWFLRELRGRAVSSSTISLIIPVAIMRNSSTRSTIRTIAPRSEPTSLVWSVATGWWTGCTQYSRTARAAMRAITSQTTFSRHGSPLPSPHGKRRA